MFRINAPDRLSLDSSADTFSSQNNEFHTFRNELNTAVLDAKRIQLMRATIPNIRFPVPSYQLVFYYYALSSITQVPTAAELKAVRLYPPDYVAPSGFTAFTRMTNTVTPTELATLLTTASTAGGDDITYNTLWVSGGLTFSYSVATSKISITSLAAGGIHFAVAGWNDPLVLASQADSTKVKQNLVSGIVIQPFALGYTMNLRLGYSLSGVCAQPQRSSSSVSFKVAQITGVPVPQNGVVVADTVPCLVGTQCIYLYSTVVGNSGNASNNKKNLLAVIPADQPSFGVINYSAVLENHALKVPREFYAVDIEMRDDANQPFLLPDSANVNLELAIRYD